MMIISNKTARPNFLYSIVLISKNLFIFYCTYISLLQKKKPKSKEVSNEGNGAESTEASGSDEDGRRSDEEKSKETDKLRREVEMVKKEMELKKREKEIRKKEHELKIKNGETDKILPTQGEAEVSSNFL